MTILIVGAGGFIGRRIVEFLGSGPAGEDFSLVLWRQSEHGSLLEASNTNAVLAAISPSAVINLAWASTSQAQYEHDPANHLWAAQSLEFALSVTRHCGHYITFGSAAELTGTAATPYADAKRHLLRGIRESLPPESWTWLRPQWVYSWVDRRPRLLAAARAESESGRMFRPRTATAHHDFIEVTDVAAATAVALKHTLKGELDIATGLELTVETFLRSLGIPCASGTSDDLPRSQPGRTQPSADLLVHGWRPVVSLQQLRLN